MPGVPSGTGCDNCRKSKKKVGKRQSWRCSTADDARCQCDEVKPVCTRCARRGIECVGAGEKRYKFMEEGPTIVKKRTPKRPEPTNTNNYSKTAVRRITSNPSNPAQLIAQGLVAAIHPQTSLRYNLMWAYGGYLMLIPRRLGRNEALDAAVDVLITAHRSYASCKEIGLSSLTKYSNALSALCRRLNDPSTATTSETLCAVSVLLVAQHMLGTSELKWTGHAEGAARLLKARKTFAPRDAFERILLLSLRGPVLFEGLFNPNIELTQDEWQELVVNELDVSTPEGLALRNLALVPGIVHRVKTNPDGLAGLLILQAEMKSLYTKTRSVVKLFGIELHELETPGSKAPANPLGLSPIWAHAHVQRLYGLCITIALYMNYTLVAMKTDDPDLIIDANYLALEMISVAENALQYRPFGGAYVLMGLAGAMMVVQDPKLQALVMGWIDDYRSDFDMPYFEPHTIAKTFSRLDPFRNESLGASSESTEQALYNSPVKEEVESPRIVELRS